MPKPEEFCVLKCETTHFVEYRHFILCPSFSLPLFLFLKKRMRNVTSNYVVEKANIILIDSSQMSPSRCYSILCEIIWCTWRILVISVLYITFIDVLDQNKLHDIKCWLFSRIPGASRSFNFDDYIIVSQKCCSLFLIKNIHTSNCILRPIFIKSSAASSSSSLAQNRQSISRNTQRTHRTSSRYMNEASGPFFPFVAIQTHWWLH